MDRIYNYILISLIILVCCINSHGHEPHVPKTTFNLGSDTIPPVITELAYDKTVICNGNSLDSLLQWYHLAGGAEAMDDSGEYFFLATLEESALIDSFQQSSTFLCGNTGIITVGFFAVDTCGNRSVDTSYATFNTLDDIKPRITRPALGVSGVSCQENLDSLLTDWINQYGGAEATDNCSDSLLWNRFIWQDNANNSGAGELTGGPYLDIDHSVCDWYVNVSFIVEDLCGNIQATTARFSTSDTLGPSFITELPMDITVSCDSIPLPMIVEAEDLCQGVLTADVQESSTQANDPSSCEYFNYSIERSYTVIDACGNSIHHAQTITIKDTIPPGFIAPLDITVSCLTGVDTTITGTPFIQFDNCSDEFSLNFIDEFVQGDCTSTITRFWELVDVCGNKTVIPQKINITDDTAPIIIEQAKDTAVYCDLGEQIFEVYQEWIARHGDALAEDGCNELNWYVAQPGAYELGNISSIISNPPQGLENMNCHEIPGLIKKGTVDFIAVDLCGNATMTQAVMEVWDTTAPIFVEIPQSFAVQTSNQNCGELVSLPFPKISDNCTTNFSPNVRNISREIHSMNPGIDSIPVEIVELRFGPYFLQNTLASGYVSLQLEFSNIDADEITEYFEIYTEEGEFLANSNLSLAECATSNILIENISPQNINNWAQDGFISFFLEPNIPEDKTKAINDICLNTSLESVLSFEVELAESFTLELRINNAEYSHVPLEEHIDTFLNVGTYEIDFRVTDCAQNSTSTSYQVQVRDDAPPNILCPNDMILFLEEGECDILVELREVVEIDDACGSQDIYLERIPDSEREARISFIYNQELDDFVAVNKQFIFLGVNSNAFSSDPILTIEYLGDMEELGEFYTIYGEDGYLLGTNEIGQNHVMSGNCDKPGKAEFNIPRSVFNDWANDGFIEITAVSNQQGPNLINPCDPFQVQSDGDTDLISSLFATLQYERHTPKYTITGSTEISLSEFPKPSFLPQVVLNQGVNTVQYLAVDESGNQSQCSYNIEVIDQEPPEISCQNIFLNIHPSGLISVDLDTAELITEFYDNCTIASIVYEPAELTCQDAGSEVPLIVTVADQNGNISSCQTTARVEVLELNPMFSAAICGDDTLKLFANAPLSPDPNAYVYSWTGPNNFSSNEEDPIIVNAGSEYSGIYNLQITGFNSCLSSGSVEVFIEELSTPALSSNQLEYCQGEQVVFNATSFTGEISYKWYEGIFPNGILLETTLSSTFVMQPTLGEHLYYVIVESPNCISNASASFLIDVIEPPEPKVEDSFVTVCEGEQVMITAENVNIDFEYMWSGPNGFFSSEPTAIVTPNASLADQGIYNLLIANGECNSDTASVQLVVFDKPIKPIIEAENVVCPGGTIMVSVSNLTDADQYTWLLNGSLFSNQTNNTLIIDNAQASHSGFWQVYVEDNFCRSDSSAAIQISVETQIQIGATNDGPVCVGDSVQLSVTSIPNAQYLWLGPNGVESLIQNPKVKAVAGSYEVIVTTEAGCSSTTNTFVDTRIPPEITALSNSSTPCMDGMTDVALVSTIFPPNDYLYQWRGPNGFTSADSLPIISNFNSDNNGIYLLQVSDGLCISEPVQTIIRVVDIPESPVLQAPESLCEGETLVITIENGGDEAELFHWETPKGLFTLLSPSFVIPDASLSDAGIYAVSASVNGCSSEPSIPVNVRINSKPIPPVPQSNSPVCEGETIELKAPFISGVEYEWVGPNSFSSSARNPEIFEATNANEGAYIMRILKESCPSPWSEAIFINVKETPPLPLINQEDLEFCRTDLPSSITLCLDEASTIEGSIYDWELLNLDLLISRTISNCISFDDFDRLDSGENLISVFADRNGCFAPFSDPLVITVNDIPNDMADAGEDMIVCDEGEVFVNANNTGTVSGFWSSHDGNVHFESANSSQSKVTGLKNGENLVFWTLSDPLCGIYSTDSLIITIESIPKAIDDNYMSAYSEELHFFPLENDVVPDSYTIEVVSSAIGGELTLDGDEFYYSPRSSFIGSDRIIYRLCNTSCPDICSDAEIKIQIGESTDCFVSTIITPNGDGSNDYMVIPCLESGNYPNNRLIVFNIWGDEVFAKSPYTNNWDGRHRDKILAAGTYYFVLDLQDGSPAIHGFVIIEQ